ncbi:MAG: hypothetical protein ACI4PD_05890, partial [Butyricicoccus sp.]
MKMWKRITSLVLVLCMMLPMFCFSAGAATVNGTTISIAVGERFDLSELNSRADLRTWTVSDETVAEVGDDAWHWKDNPNGIGKYVDGLKNGTVTLTSTNMFGEQEIYTLIIGTGASAPTLTVQAKVGTGDWQTISSPYNVDAGSLEVNGQITLGAQASWSDETAYEITAWNSKDTGVATVVGGTVTAVAAGETTITATLTNKTDDTDTITVSFAVKVNEPKLNVTAFVNSAEVELTGTGNEYSAPATTLYVGDEKLNTAALAAAATKGGTDYTESWAITKGADKVSFASGTVTALAAGEATVTATLTSEDGSDVVTVTFPIT